MRQNSIWTIGHSTRTLEEFIMLLNSFQIELLVDIRRYPNSKRYPYFNKEALQQSLPEQNIAYAHLVNLGGRRKPRLDSHNTGWRVAAFRGYADYMETNDFKIAIKELESSGNENRVAFMCSEAVWWSCHRSLVSDYLKFNGWLVWHIMGQGKAEEHPYTRPAIVSGDNLLYNKQG